MRAPWITVACVLVPLVAAADDNAATNVTKGDELFEQAKRLEAEGKLTESCAKFHESLTYNPHAIGTILNVAACEEKLNQLASALKHFTEARDRAREGNLESHRKVAEEHIATLTPIVPHLTITFTDVAPDTKLLVDDHAVTLEEASNLAVDPGTRKIVVTAPGRLPFESDVSIEKGERSSLTVPKLALPVKNWRRITGLTVGLAGATAFLTSVGLGYYAYRQYNDQFDQVPPNCVHEGNLCNAQGLDKTQRAQRLGTISTIVGITGLVVFAGGAVLYVTAPKKASTERNVSVIPTLAPDGLGVVATGSF